MLPLLHHALYSKFIVSLRRRICLVVMELIHGGDKHDRRYTEDQARGYQYMY
jgi:hypothetical protein